jgi:hypothetical protein
MSAASPLRRHAVPPTAVSLRRWLCTWLALLTALQMIGSPLAGLHGPWHRHRPPLQSAAASVPLIQWQHGGAMPPAGAGLHAQLHALGQPHDHAATDASVLPPGNDTAADAVAQLALAPGASVLWGPHEAARHVRASAPAWAPTSRSVAPPLQPPRG